MCQNRLPVEIFICFKDNFNAASFCGIFVSRLITSIEARNGRSFTFVFSMRGMICDFDVGCSNVSRNFVMHRTRFYWIIRRKPKIPVLLLGVSHVISNLALGVGQLFLCRKEGVGHVFFINHISKCSGPPPYTFWPVPKGENIIFETLTDSWPLPKSTPGW